MLGGVILTGIITGRVDLAIFGTIAIALMNLLINFINIFNNIKAVTNPNFTPILVFIFAPLMFLFVVTVLEWWRGITT